MNAIIDHSDGKKVSITYEELESKLRRLIADGKGYDLVKIKQAYEFANEAHAGQMRKSGEPYISHPLSVAYTLLDYSMDSDALVAALLHDVVEDTKYTLDDVSKLFGSDVAAMVDGLTKISFIPMYTKEEKVAETVRKILMSMSKDIRIIVIKLSDRLHNMRTLGVKTESKRIATSIETLSVYAPIAHRLGMNDIKDEMQDLSLKYIDPYAYEEIQEHISIGAHERDTFIEGIKELIFDRILTQNACINPPVIEGRVKSVYSIFKKVYGGNKQFSEVYDTFAVRVITETVDECYRVFGIIQNLFTSLPNRFKDYIAQPKPNNYQSLHTTVLTHGGVPFEVQIRTRTMHETAELGVAAHWKYKSRKTRSEVTETSEQKRRLDWIRDLLEQQQGADDIEFLTESIKNELAEDTVYVFSPKGEVTTLPTGSNVIDFAYSVHTDIGNQMNGAIVNGKMVGFGHVLSQGEVVEIKTGGRRAGASGPKRDWLDSVKTNEAKSKIRAWFKRERRPENIEFGKSILGNEFQKQRLSLDDAFLEDTIKHYNFANIDDLYASVGYGGISVEKIITQAKHAERKARIASGKTAEPAPQNGIDSEKALAEETRRNVRRRQKSGVIVDGYDDIAVRYAQCCNPLPGDEIIGFMTKGYGIAVHKRDCRNIESKVNDPVYKDRLRNTVWAATGTNKCFRVTVNVVAGERNGLLADVSQTISGVNIPIIDSNSHRLKNGNAEVNCTIEIASLEMLDNLLAKIRKLRSVISVERAGRQ
ncbi:(p)ppGpp synthetase [Clostridia bacterium]|nr:(p)ppGpp synthetase [Clostridia bacterium]